MINTPYKIILLFLSVFIIPEMVFARDGEGALYFFGIGLEILISFFIVLKFLIKQNRYSEYTGGGKLMLYLLFTINTIWISIVSTQIIIYGFLPSPSSLGILGIVFIHIMFVWISFQIMGYVSSINKFRISMNILCICLLTVISSIISTLFVF